MMWAIVWLLCFSCATAHVKDLSKEHSHISISASKGNVDLSSEPKPAVWEPTPVASSLRGTEGSEAISGRLDSLFELPQKFKGQCVWMALAVGCLCCCGGVLKLAVGEHAASQIGFFITFFVFFYLMFSGIYSAYWRGEHVGTWCKILCWWAIFMMCFLPCWCCCVCMGYGVMLGIKNGMVKIMRQQYEEKIENVSGPRKDYYESDFFKEKCDQIFEKADKDRSGSLDFSQLQAALVDATGHKEFASQESMLQVQLLQEAFEEHGDSVVEKHEFVEIMKFVSVMALQEGKVTLDQAFEILQCPKTATKSEVRKAYYKMAQKYHPDKQFGGDPEKIKRDMAEINDANACIEDHFKNTTSA